MVDVNIGMGGNRCTHILGGMPAAFSFLLVACALRNEIRLRSPPALVEKTFFERNGGIWKALLTDGMTKKGEGEKERKSGSNVKGKATR